MKKIIFSLLLLLVGCRQNPFPDTGKLMGEKEADPTPVPKPFILDVPNSIKGFEGETVEIKIVASVPKPSKSIVSVKDLPEGASFFEDEMLIRWTPDFAAANDLSNPKVVMKNYTIKVFLRGSLDSVSMVQKEITLWIYDTQRDFHVDLSLDSSYLTEGKKFLKTFKIVNEDFPLGPFLVETKGLPPGASVTPVLRDPSLYTLEYFPDWTTVNILDDISRYRKFPLEVVVLNPRGQIAKAEGTLQVDDKRVNGNFSGPRSIEAWPNVQFTFGVDDPNREASPMVRLIKKPDFGSFSLKKLESNEETPIGVMPSSQYQVNWTEITPDKIDSVHEIKFDVCVYSSPYRQDYCSVHTVEVSLKGVLHKAPEIERTSWPRSNIKYLRVGEKLSVPLRVRDVEFPSFRPVVTIEPAGLPVRWNESTNTLDLSPTDIGLIQFNLTASSKFGQIKTESFLYETLASSWKDVVMVGETMVNHELIETAKMFGGFDVLNPILQTIDEKLLALRSVLVLGTHSFKLTADMNEIDEMVTKIKNIVLLSPLLQKSSPKLLDEIRNLGIEWDVRFLDKGLILSDFSVESKLSSKASSRVSLTEKLSDESKSPQLLILNASSKCKVIMNLVGGQLGQVFPVAVKCKRGNGGTLLISGFEWGDMSFSLSDIDLPRVWMKEVINP